MPILMQEQIESRQPTIDDLYEAYKLDVDRLGCYYLDNEFKSIVDQFSSFSKTLKILNKHPANKQVIKSVLKSADFIDIQDQHVAIKHRKILADLSGMCSEFDTWKVFLGKDIQGISEEYLKYNLSQIDASNQMAVNQNYVKLDLSDTARCTSLLKLFGLLPVNLHNYNLLSIGAAAGNRERYAMNTLPVIETNVNADKSQLLVRFSHKDKAFKKITLIDSDPFWSELYSQLNAGSNEVMSYNYDMFKSLDFLEHAIQQGKTDKIDLITIWRLEHLAYEDIDRLFKRLKSVMSDKAHLVFTIGAGNTDEEFSLRQHKLLEIKEYLEARSASPVLFKLHNGDRLSPVFGHFRFASHELLHCKVNVRDL